MELREVMTPDVAVVRPDMPLVEAAQMMREIDSGFLPVGEGDRLIGTLTDRDIVIRAVAEGRDPNETLVRDAMTDDLVYCFADQDVEEAAELMGQYQVRRLPVVDRDKRLVGVVSLGDIFVMADADPADQAADQGVQAMSDVSEDRLS